jgi:hypothetical protein
MSDVPKSGSPPKTSLYAIGIAVGVAIALSIDPSWRSVPGGVVAGVTFGLVAPIVQAHRSKGRWWTPQGACLIAIVLTIGIGLLAYIVIAHPVR